MLKIVLTGCVTVALGMSAPSGLAAANSKVAEAANPQPLSPQQQQMQDCAAKWKEEKANSSAKGRAAYNKFMSACLKKSKS
jgi:hypothetical protein